MLSQEGERESSVDVWHVCPKIVRVGVRFPEGLA